jgi:S1-C subfamily serine protease
VAAAVAAGVAVLSMGLTAVLSLSGDPKATELAMKAGAEQAREVERLRQSLQERDRELEQVKQELSRGEDVPRLEKYLREIEDLKRAKQQLEHATARAVKGREEWTAKLKTLESSAPRPAAPATPAAPSPPAAEGPGVEAVARAAIPCVALVRSDSGVATGFFVSPSGELLTPYHVISRSKKIEVEFVAGGERKTARARAIAIHLQMDLALLSVDVVGTVPALTLRPGPAPARGDRVVLVANPRVGNATLEHTVAEGVVSALVQTNAGRALLQTTAPINDGADGGPLLDLKGAVVGVALARAPDVAGIGFAIPSAPAIAFLAARDQHAVGASQAEWEVRWGIIPPITHDPSLGIPIDGAPTRLYVSEDGDRVAAFDPSVNGVHVVSLSDKKVLARLYTQSNPSDMAPAPGGRSVWVVHKSSNEVVRVDLDKAALAERLTMPGQFGRRLALSKTHLWVLPTNGSTLTGYSFREKTWVTTLSQEQVSHFALDSRRDLLLHLRSGPAVVEAEADRVFSTSLHFLRLRPDQGKERQALQADYAKLYKAHKNCPGAGYSYESLMWTDDRTARLFLGRTIFKLDNLDIRVGTLPSTSLSPTKRTAWERRVL